jgi:hypothetical protein
MSEETNIDIAFQFVECINRRDLDGLVALMTADHTFFDLEGDAYSGRETMRRGWANYFGAYPHYMIHIHEFHDFQDRIIFIGSTTGSHLELPRRIEFNDPLIWTARIVADHVAEWHIYDDTPEVREELDLPPA